MLAITPPEMVRVRAVLHAISASIRRIERQRVLFAKQENTAQRRRLPPALGAMQASTILTRAAPRVKIAPPVQIPANTPLRPPLPASTAPQERTLPRRALPLAPTVAQESSAGQRATLAMIVMQGNILRLLRVRAVRVLRAVTQSHPVRLRARTCAPMDIIVSPAALPAALARLESTPIITGRQPARTVPLASTLP